jgi:oxygen-independent coproporphyrinogen-3 oxidase
MPPETYVDWVRTEIRNRHFAVPTHEISTLYFGGGTPSLLPPSLIISIMDELANAGFHWQTSCEITIEINPATLSEANIQQYVDRGINRFSVGAQTFNDDFLKMCGRKHSAQDTIATLELLNQRGLQFSFDLLFALPGQTLAHVREDLRLTRTFLPNHVSAYCLTVPAGHPMASGRAPEGEQLAMFDEIESQLAEIGVLKYEISNFARPGFESRHNLAYWSDQDYWGLGLSSHSYFRAPEFGLRFWNPKDFGSYELQIQQSLSADSPPYAALPSSQVERLQIHEALTDYCHIFLRTRSGLPMAGLEAKFGSFAKLVRDKIPDLVRQGLLTRTPGGVRLSTQGEAVSNRVFAEFTFLSEDLRVNEATSGAEAI